MHGGGQRAQSRGRRRSRRDTGSSTAKAPAAAALSAGPVTISMPSGRARVRTTSSVCAKHIVGDEKAHAPALAHPQAQRHRLGRGRRLVQHRGVRDRHAGEIADHRLEVDERLEPPLRDFRLVRRVGGVPGRVLEDVAQDHARRVRAVVALPDHRRQHAVLRGDRPAAARAPPFP